ncbi:hypothetical protein EVAR_41907_1 [Eumeta japonica]|uniref:HAT C-terminal dimerisation domain-containing protein n=1 Tax=Eumeta variegata TaxID=151549 RepID=A0A4C1XM02_EUMVA|nr:hypothetical protein EVAR_41907_1 [Eumeta japonica]
MIKVGRLVCAEQQLCLAHGINLAVCDVLYKKHNYLQDSPTSDDMDDNNDDDHLEDLDCSESVDRIKQRRSDNLTGVLNYLQNPRKDEENQLLSELEWHNLFPVPTQALLRKQIKSIVKRLNSRDDTEEEERSESLTDVELRPETSQPQLTLKEKLQLEIDKSMKSPDPEIQVQNESGMTNSIRREMSLFENGGVRGYYLETAYKYLMSIPPTSVEPERAFSAAAYVGNKLRSRLGSQTLDALIFCDYIFKILNRFCVDFDFLQ